jgi:hypothetical protein
MMHLSFNLWFLRRASAPGEAPSDVFYCHHPAAKKRMGSNRRLGRQTRIAFLGITLATLNA